VNAGAKRVISGACGRTVGRMRSALLAILALALFAAPAHAAGTRITLAGSEFGPMLWGPKKQAIYVFQRDGFKRSRCTGDCAKAWPPVYTSGKPVAGKGTRQSLLGTIRRGSRQQVTYRGRPLYYYAHEGSGEVRCHDVNLHGGLWWVIGANGKRRP
jgi:predicted lipoprotein with Yx(FWY)xxD motif